MRIERVQCAQCHGSSDCLHAVACQSHVSGQSGALNTAEIVSTGSPPLDEVQLQWL